jgi:hypothetical protein
MEHVPAILPLDEFMKLPVVEQETRLLEWRKHFKSKDIRSEWGIDPNRFYKILNELGIPKRPKGGATWELPIPTATKLSDLPSYRAKQEIPAISGETAEPPATNPLTPVQIEHRNHRADHTSGLQIHLTGTLEGDKLASKFAGLARLLEGSNGKYTVSLHLEESPTTTKE